MIDSEVTQVPSDEDYKMEIQLSSTEDAASCIEEDEGRDAVDTAESEEIDLEALMQRYQGSLSVSMSGGEDSEPVQNVASADSDVKETDDDDDLDEDEYAARANDIMQRYKMQYALSDDTEQTCTDSNDVDDDVDDKSQVDVDEESEHVQECIDTRAEQQMLESSAVVTNHEEDGEVGVVEAIDLLDNVEIGEELGSETFVEDSVEHVQSETFQEEFPEEETPESVEESNLDEFEPEQIVSIEKEGVEIDTQQVVETETAEVEDLIEIGEEIQEEEVYASTSNVADTTEVKDNATCDSVVAEVKASDSKVIAEAEASTDDAESSEDLEDMINKLTQENEALRKKKELKKRIFELSQENDKLKMSPQRNALAQMACKFDDAVATAVAKVSKIMVCAPEDEDIFDHEGGFPHMAEDDENMVGDLGQFEYKQVQVLSPVSHMTDENTNYFQSAPARPNSYQLKIQAYNEKYQDHKPEPAVSVNEVLQEARIASGVPADANLDLALRRVEEAKRYIKNRSVLKAKPIV